MALTGRSIFQLLEAATASISGTETAPTNKAIEEIKLAIEKNNSSLVSIEALKAIDGVLKVRIIK